MERPLAQIFETLQKLVGFHRQLLEATRVERDALIQANLDEIQKVLAIKQTLIESIHQAEAVRLKQVGELADIWKKPISELTLKNMIVVIQGTDLKAAEQFRSVLNTLTILIQRVIDQNIDNRQLIDKSMEHFSALKNNVLGESVPKGNTYSPQGQTLRNKNNSRFISKEV